MNVLKKLAAKPSKKLSVAFISIVLVSLKDYFAWSPEDIQAIMAISGAYLVGQGVADHGIYSGHGSKEK